MLSSARHFIATTDTVQIYAADHPDDATVSQ